jgi:hypothetical protein
LQLDGQLDIWMDSAEDIWMDRAAAVGRAPGKDAAAAEAVAGLGLPGLLGLPPLLPALDILQLPGAESLSDYLLPESAEAQSEAGAYGAVATAFALVAACTCTGTAGCCCCSGR